MANSTDVAGSACWSRSSESKETNEAAAEALSLPRMITPLLRPVLQQGQSPDTIERGLVKSLPPFARRGEMK
jgi:hypothetical protein